MQSPDPTRLTLITALAALATLNALLWVTGLRLADRLLGLDVPTSALGAVAVFSGLAVVLIGAAHLREPAPTHA